MYAFIFGHASSVDKVKTFVNGWKSWMNNIKDMFSKDEEQFKKNGAGASIVFESDDCMFWNNPVLSGMLDARVADTRGKEGAGLLSNQPAIVKTCRKLNQQDMECLARFTAELAKDKDGRTENFELMLECTSCPCKGSGIKSTNKSFCSVQDGQWRMLHDPWVLHACNIDCALEIREDYSQALVGEDDDEREYHSHALVGEDDGEDDE
jgi:hypothetical protein